MKEIPRFLEEILIENYGEKIKEKIIEGYKKEKKVTLRINTLKTEKEKIIKTLKKEKIKYEEIKWNKDALIIENVKENEIKKLEIYINGEIYLQNLSSMLPPIYLEPKPNENILDMAAAPGGKTTQIAALTKNEAMITACEKNKIRLERLKYNIEKQGARANLMLCDSSQLDNYFSFDKILLDSPCSGSGTKNIFEKNFTKNLIEKSKKMQEKLLEKAVEITKPKGEILYSTCSILKEENEKIIKKILKKGKVEIIKIKEIEEMPLLPVEIEGTISVAPNEIYEGFFLAKLRKI